MTTVRLPASPAPFGSFAVYIIGEDGIPTDGYDRTNGVALLRLQAEGTLDADGEAEVVLLPTDAVTPAGTRYRAHLRAQGGSVAMQVVFDVPDSEETVNAVDHLSEVPGALRTAALDAHDLDPDAHGGIVGGGGDHPDSDHAGLATGAQLAGEATARVSADTAEASARATADSALAAAVAEEQAARATDFDTLDFSKASVEALAALSATVAALAAELAAHKAIAVVVARYTAATAATVTRPTGGLVYWRGSLPLPAAYDPTLDDQTLYVAPPGSVAGSQATDTATPTGGTEAGTAVAGRQATDTATATPGAAGGPGTGAGSQATDTSTATGGTEAGTTVAGSQATETATATSGTASSGGAAITTAGGLAITNAALVPITTA